MEDLSIFFRVNRSLDQEFKVGRSTGSLSQERQPEMQSDVICSCWFWLKFGPCRFKNRLNVIFILSV